MRNRFLIALCACMGLTVLSGCTPQKRVEITTAVCVNQNAIRADIHNRIEAARTETDKQKRRLTIGALHATLAAIDSECPPL